MTVKISNRQEKRKGCQLFADPRVPREGRAAAPSEPGPELRRELRFEQVSFSYGRWDSPAVLIAHRIATVR
jgi:hypothetical protein